MALNDTFNILLIKNHKFGDNLTSYLLIKDYWEEECKEYPSKQGCLLYCD